jgi:transketolase
MTISPSLDEKCINTLRLLAVDMVEKANSGHPGAPMGAAPMAFTLFDRFLKHNPADPRWPDRDRFVLSAGHASALLYALLHLTGYEVSLDDLKSFRQWGSRTPGHPEAGHTPGVEATTGPLGQGFAMGVGMAIAERWLAARYNRPGHDIINHHTYALVSDGDLMEGVASEAASLAGTLKLGKIIYLYDDNRITIDGPTALSFTENVAERFRAYGWNVIGPIDGMAPEAVDSALRAARSQEERPNLIIGRTIIGCGSPKKANTSAAHGEPLGAEEVKATRENLSCQWLEPFSVPHDVLVHTRTAINRGERAHKDWEKKLDAYRAAYPAEAGRLERELEGGLPDGWQKTLDGLYPPGAKPVSTREACGKALNALAGQVGSLIGGSADLAGSVKTLIKDRGVFGPADPDSPNLYFGVREHAMGALANGLALHGGTIPYTGTFLVFADYMRPPIRLAAMMGLRVIFIFSHDSIGLGQDGPTHQPVEQLAGLRAIPRLAVMRPADAGETAECWKAALLREGPTVMVTTRQNLDVLDRTRLAPAAGAQRGGYVLWEAGPKPEAILIGTGSEVHLALEAGRLLKDQGVKARVVSLPSWELFSDQPQDYQDAVLSPSISARVSIEAASTFGWERWVGENGVAMGLDDFGASAPGPLLYEKRGLTAARMAEQALQVLGRSQT